MQDESTHVMVQFSRYLKGTGHSRRDSVSLDKLRQQASYVAQFGVPPTGGY